MSKIVSTPMGYELDAEKYYEQGSVGNRGRMDKICVYCGKKIPKGQPHDTHKFYGEDGDWPTYPTHKMNPDHGDNPAPGEETCTSKFLKLFR